MGYHGTHKNDKSGERLAQNVLICPMCFKNFASDKAANKHYVRENFPNPSYCLKPEEVGLKEFKNTFGSVVYR